MAILDPEKFLPNGTKNTLKSNGAWAASDDADWAELVEKLEKSSISVIRANVNFSAIEKDTELLEELLSKHVQSQLYSPLIHMQGMQEAGELALAQFNELITIIRENQKDLSISTSEKSSGVSGLLIFNN